MSYIGNKPSQTLASPTSQYFNGDGSTVAFTLNRSVNVAEDLEVFVNNIQQEPGVGKSYTATGTTLTFDAAPSAGTANVYVVYRGLAEVTTRLEHDPNAALAATNGTFSGDLTVDNNTLYVDSANNRVGIGTQGPGSTLEVAGAIQATGDAITVSDNGFNSRINLFNTGSGGSNFSLYSTMSSFSQGANTFLLYSPSATNGIIKADVDGHVTMPYNPAFGAYTDGTNVNLTTFRSTTNVIQFNRIGGATWTFDRGSNFNTTTYTFTAPVAGVYMFYVRLQLNNMSCTNTDWAVNLHFQVNGGGNYANGYYTATTAANDGPDYHIHEKVAHINLSANDGVRVAMSGNSTVQGTLETQTSDGRCYFSGHLVS